MSRAGFALAVDARVRHPSWPQGEYVTIVEVDGDVFYAADADGATDYYFAGDNWDAMPADAERPSDLLEAFAAVNAAVPYPGDLATELRLTVELAERERNAWESR